MAIVTRVGRVLFGIPMIVFGIQHFIYSTFVTSLIPPWIPARTFWTYFCGVALIAAGTSLVVGKVARLAGLLLGLMLFILFALVHAPLVAATPGDPNQWTYLTQAFTFSGLALVVGASAPGSCPPAATVRHALTIGSWIAGIGLAILGARQLFQIPFILNAIPAWPPSRTAWTVAVGALLLTTGVATLLRRQRVPALLLGGVLLLFWVLVHLPAVVSHPHTADWAPFCKDAIVGGGVLVLAGIHAGRRTR
jgi:uncharacterized membrane protein